MSKLPTELLKEILLIVPVAVLEKGYFVREIHYLMNSPDFWLQRNDRLSDVIPLDFPPTFKHLERLITDYKFTKKLRPNPVEKKFLIHLSIVNPSLLKKFDRIYTWFNGFDYLLEVMPRYVKVLEYHELTDIQAEIYSEYRRNFELIYDRRSAYLDHPKHMDIVQNEIKLRSKIEYSLC